MAFVSKWPFRQDYSCSLFIIFTILLFFHILLLHFIIIFIFIILTMMVARFKGFIIQARDAAAKDSQVREI